MTGFGKLRLDAFVIGGWPAKMKSAIRPCAAAEISRQIEKWCVGKFEIRKQPISYLRFSICERGRGDIHARVGQKKGAPGGAL